MYMSQSFGRTLRAAPSDAESASQQLLLRGGFIRQLASGIYSELPLGRRVTARIEGVLREEMRALGAQELRMPVVQPADIWRKTGRWSAIGPELGRLVDRQGRDLALAMTHEEVVAELTRSEVESHRDLPALVYHIQTKWRDDPRPRAGLVRVREFTMLDSYSLDADDAGLDAQYAAHDRAYRRIFHRLGLPVVAVEADVGMMGGRESQEYMVLADIGEDTLLLCTACGLRANRQVARFGRPAAHSGEVLTAEPVATPGADTIEALAAFLGVPTSATAKAVFFADGEDRVVLAIVRGDMTVNETKVAHLAGSRDLRPATSGEIAAAGAVAGYASAVGLTPGARLVVLVDETVAAAGGLVAGANRPGFHLLNTLYGRDYGATAVGDLAVATAGAPCPRCGAALAEARGVEVGNIFKLGTFYSEAMGCTFLDATGVARPVVMGSYGIGVGRAMACIAELHHDDGGLAWPVAAAPFDVHVVALPGGEAEAAAAHDVLAAAGFEVLLDERDERPGVKFADADLIGVPVRVTVGPRSLKAGGAEVALRRGLAEASVVPLDGLAAHVAAQVRALRAELMPPV